MQMAVEYWKKMSLTMYVFGFVSLVSYCNQVKVVAHVVSVQKHATNHVYVMEDRTGTVEVQDWTDVEN